MVSPLRYDNTRLFFVIFLAIALYFFAIPVVWPPPRISVELPEVLQPGEDLTVRMTVRAWHPNFRVRQVSFSIDGIGSSAYASRKLYVPLNLHERERTTDWTVGFAERTTWPRKRSFVLTVPAGRMFRSGTLREGVLSGGLGATVDYTRVTFSTGYPALHVERSIPYSLRIGS